MFVFRNTHLGGVATGSMGHEPHDGELPLDWRSSTKPWYGLYRELVNILTLEALDRQRFHLYPQLCRR